jgi:excisionase family DNA binding protein
MTAIRTNFATGTYREEDDPRPVTERHGVTPREQEAAFIDQSVQATPLHFGDGLLRAADVAELLKVPTSWVYAETRAGRIPHVCLGPRYRRYRRKAIEAWVAELERGPTPYRKYRPSGAQPDG